MKRWRVMTWLVLAFNLLMLIWLVAGVGGAAQEGITDCAGLAGRALSNCEAGNAGTAVGAGIGAAIIIFLWAMGDVILGVIWLVTRKKEPQTVIVQQVVRPPVATPPASPTDQPPAPPTAT